MGIPVVVAANGYGIPVTIATNGYGLPVEVASNGYGMPVVLVASGGLPVVGTFGPDVTAPLAVSFSPTDNSTGVNTATLLIVTFDSVVTLGTGNVTLKKTSDNSTVEAWNVATEAGTGAGQVSVEFSTQLTMRLTTSIAGGTEYYVIWDANVVKDIANNPVAANASTTLWSFTTAGSAYDAATEAIAAAFTTPPTTARKNLIDAAVVALKSAGVWAKLDALYAFAAADSQAAKINWIAPGTYNCTEVSSPTFTADQGFTGASTKYLDSTFNPSTAPSPKYVQNSACAFGFSNTNVLVLGGIVGNNALTELGIYPRNAGNVFDSRINQGSANLSAANTDSTGFYSASRSSSTLTTAYKNAVSVGTAATASSAIFNTTISFLRATSTSYWTGQITAGGFGQNLDGTEQTALYNALAAYMAGLATDRIAAAFTTPPTAGRKTLIQNCVTSLMQAGVWDKLDALYAFAAADSQAAKINWKAPGTYNCTEVNAPTFAADLGFTGASTKYLDSTFNPTTAPSPKYVLNNASQFGWSNTVTAIASGPIGVAGNGVSGESYLMPYHTSTLFYGRVHNSSSGTDDSIANPYSSALGLWVGSRTASTTVNYYRNGGASFYTAANTGGTPYNGNFLFLYAHGANWTGQVCAGGFGQGLNSTEQTALYNALRTYMTGVGVP